MTHINTNTLINLWEKVLGTPTPSEQQFLIWLESHPADVVRHGILKAATKNQTMGGTMSEDHKIRFASKVMLTLSAQREEQAANRERLRQEFEQVQQPARINTTPDKDLTDREWHDSRFTEVIEREVEELPIPSPVEGVSVGCKSLDVGDMYSPVNTATPKWAVERQLSAARCRLGELEAKLQDLLQRDKSVSDVETCLGEVRDYIADLEAWSVEKGVTE